MSIKKSYDSWSEQYDINENKTRDLDQKVTIKTLSRFVFDVEEKDFPRLISFVFEKLWN
ncbi:hypothetical protein KAJ27_13235 [bacterium]|nr:hypothetical protein [bacterium]